MIKIFNRILYAILMFVLFLIVVGFVVSQRESKILVDLSKEKFENKDYSFFIPTVYYKKEPLKIKDDKKDITLNGEKIDFYIYEVISIYKGANDEKYQYTPGLYFLFVGEKNNVQTEITVKIKKKNEDKFVETNLRKYDNEVPIFLPFKTDMPLFLELKEFKQDDDTYGFEKIEIEGNEITLDSNYEKHELLEALKKHEEEHKKMPSDDFGIIKKNEVFKIDSTKEIIITFVIFTIIAVIATYYIFRKKKDLGKEEISPGLKKDLEEISES